MEKIQHKANISCPEKMTLGALASHTQATLLGDPQIVIEGVGTLSAAKPGQISFLADAKYQHYLSNTQASAVILTKACAQESPVPVLICEEPKLAFAKIVHLLYPRRWVEPHQHPTALIGEASEIDPSAYIGPQCVIGARVKIAANVILEAGCFIGDDSVIQAGTVLYPKVTVYHGCTIGKECTIHSGAVIGSDGFGFAKTNHGWLKVPQIGGVKIGDRVEIGANTTIDRGAIEDTEIGNDVILDNLIQIGHNVKIGEGTAIAACVGIAGSTVIGKHCLIGGGSCINGHIAVADHVHLVGASNVAKTITQAGAYASALSVNEIQRWKRNLVRFHQLDDLAGRLKEIENKLKTKEET